MTRRLLIICNYIKERWLIFVVSFLFIKIFFVLLLTLLYWSYNTEENKVRELENEVLQLQEKITRLQKSPFQEAEKTNLISDVNHCISSESVNYGNNKDNILSDDPFFTKTLPKLLGPQFVPHGKLRMATIGRPENLMPFSPWLFVNELLGYCVNGACTVAFGSYETLTQDLAVRIEEMLDFEKDCVHFYVFLREGLVWQPLKQSFFTDTHKLHDHFLKKHPLTAYDFEFFWQALNNPYIDSPGAIAQRQLLQDISRIEAINDHTFVITAKLSTYTDSYGKIQKKLPYTIHSQLLALKPLARFVYQYFADGTKICPEDSGKNFYKESSLWAQNFAHHFALNVIPSCGPWIFDGMDDKKVSFIRNPDFYSPTHALYEEIEIFFLESPESIWRDFITQKIDVCFLSPNDLIDYERYIQSDVYKMEVAKGNEIQKLSFCQRAYNFIGWNENNPVFASAKIRKALTMAIDRKRLIEEVLHSQGVEISGPLFYDSPSYDKSIVPFPYSPEIAKIMLLEEGWCDTNGNGILQKNIGGNKTPFEFRLMYYVKNPTTKDVVDFITSELKAVGIKCIPQGVDLPDLSSAFDDKSFDAIYLGWDLGTPPEDERQVWHSIGAHVKGSSNAVSFVNKEADLIMEKLVYEEDSEARVALYHKLHKILHDEAPYTYLYTPKEFLLWWNWIDNVFIPRMRQDLIPGAQVDDPNIIYTWKRGIAES